MRHKTASAGSAAARSMLTAEEIRALIVARLQDDSSIPPINADRLEGELRALCAVLSGGDPPPRTNSITTFLDAAKIPYTMKGTMVDFPADWLRTHGFSIDEDDAVHHPTFTNESW